MILWDVKNNKELQSFDQHKDSIVFFDPAGDAYLTDGNTVTITEQNVMLKSYNVKQVKDSD